MAASRKNHFGKLRSFALSLMLTFAAAGAAFPQDAPAAPDAAKARPAIEKFMQSPAVFIENRGQWPDPSIRFAQSSMGANVGLTTAGLRFQLFERVADPARQNPRDRIRDGVLPQAPAAESQSRMIEWSATFPGARAAEPQGESKSAQVFNYRRGNPSTYRENVPSYESVIYRDLYKGIDLRVLGQRAGVKYEFIVAPGADPDSIKVHYSGIDRLALREDGSIEIYPAPGWQPLTDGAPYIYQAVGGEKKTVAGGFKLIDTHTLAFDITGEFDKSLPLVVDPYVAWSTYVGGSSSDTINGVTTDPSTGNVFVVGDTSSAGWISGGGDTSPNGGTDAFVMKLSSAGLPLWSTYLGGTSGDYGRSIATDGQGNYYVCGETWSGGGWVSGGYDTTFNNFSEAFVAKVLDDGTVEWSTYLGGTGFAWGYGIAVSGDGNSIAAVGLTSSGDWISGGYDTTVEDSMDGFVAVLDPSGNHQWSTLLGTSGLDLAFGAAFEGSDYVYVVGSTGSSDWLAGGGDTTINGDYDAFLAKLNTSGDLEWASCMGGLLEDDAFGVCHVPATGAIYVAGLTYSSGWTSGGYDTTYGGGTSLTAGDGFAAKFNDSGSLLWSTYLGGSQYDHAYAIAADTAGANIYVVGQTSSASWTSGGTDTTLGTGGADGFLVALAASGTHSSSGYLGGNSNDFANSTAVDTLGNVLVAGSTSSSGWMTVGADLQLDGSSDGFLVKIGIAGGNLQVTISPAGAVSAGAQWRRLGTLTWFNSGAAETNVPPGTHTVEFKDGISFWSPPPQQQVSVAVGQTTFASGAYTQTSSLRVSISPSGAVSAGAQWRRVGTTTWLNSGVTETGVPAGSVDIEFKDLNYWVEPQTLTTNLVLGQTTNIFSSYIQAGELRISLEPAAAVTAGAQWRVAGMPGWLNSDTVLTLPGGSHTLEFKSVNGWRGPDPESITVTNNAHTVGFRQFVAAGNLTVTISPQAAADAGAQWRRVGTTAWFNSGATEIAPAGNHSIEFKPVAGWNAPSNQNVSISQFQNVSRSGNYVLIVGSLRVNIGPAQATDLGAQWRRAGTSAWFNSGATETSVPVGNHVLEFKSLPPWISPATIASVAENQLTTLNANYSFAGLNWSTYLGGDSSESATDVAVAPSGDIYVTGDTTSPGWISGGVNPVYNGTDIYVFKLNRSGRPLWSTYFGGSSSESAGGIAVDVSGNSYIALTSSSPGIAFSGFDTTYNGSSDGMLIKLNADGGHLWSTYFGGSGTDQVSDVAVDGSGSAFATGFTSSTSWPLGGHDTSFSGQLDAFVIKISGAGEHLWSTYLGSSNLEFGNDLACDSQGNVFAVGYTNSAGWVQGGYDVTYNFSDGYLVKLSPTGVHLWSTYVGGSSSDEALAVVVDYADNVVVAGETTSGSWISGGYDTQYGGSGDAFVLKLNNGGSVLWSTYLGGAGGENANAVAVDVENNIYVTGDTSAADWITGGFDTTYNGGSSDAFAARLTSGGSLLWSTTLGGTDNDFGNGVAVDSPGVFYLAGKTESEGWTRNGYDLTRSGSTDGFVAKIGAVPFTINFNSAGAASVPVTLSQPDDYGSGSGSTNMLRRFSDGTRVVITVPFAHAGLTFTGWTGNITYSSTTLPILVNGSATLTANYAARGSLRVALGPQGAHDAGAQWRIAGETSWRNSGTTAYLAPGNHAVQFKPINDWTPPAQRVVTITINQLTAITGTYIRQTGGIKVTLTPQGAIEKGAQWRIAGEASWRNSGATIGSLPTGAYQVEFKKVATWGYPNVRTVQVLSAQIASTTALYAYNGLAWSTYIGGDEWDEANAVAVTPTGDVLVAGFTESIGWVVGGKDTSFNSPLALNDAFMAKVSSSGQHIWSTYFGSYWDDSATAISCDSAGNIYLLGDTASQNWLSGGYDNSYNGGDDYGADGFFAKFTSNGTHVWSTFIGGDRAENTYAFALNSAGESYIVGETTSAGWLTGGYDTVFNGSYFQGFNGFMIKLGSNGSYLWGTYIGEGSGSPHVRTSAYDVALDATGAPWVVGYTNMAGWVSGGFDTSYVGGDGFLVKVSTAGAHDWSTYLGGTGLDVAKQIVFDSTGAAIIGGHTTSNDWAPHLTPNASTTDDEVFLMRINSAGAPLWRCLWGGPAGESLNGLSIDKNNNIFACGTIHSPSTAGGGQYDDYTQYFKGFAAMFSPSGAHVWSSYLGRGSSDSSSAIANDSLGNAYVVGRTLGAGWTTAGYDTSHNGEADGFLAKFSAARTLTVKSIGRIGVNITLNKTDLMGRSGGAADFTRTYPAGTVVTLTAPAIVNGKEFTGWTGGAFSPSQIAINVMIDADKTYTATYGQAAARNESWVHYE